jgi:hypothetical protein
MFYFRRGYLRYHSLTTLTRITMTDSTFNALVLRQGDDKKPLATVEQLSRNDLPEGDVLVAIDYSTVNYKDALAGTRRPRSGAGAGRLFA